MCPPSMNMSQPGQQPDSVPDATVTTSLPNQSWKDKLKKVGQGALQGYQQRPQRAQQSGFEYRPQQTWPQEMGPGPLSGGMLGDYMRQLSASPDDDLMAKLRNPGVGGFPQRGTY